MTTTISNRCVALALAAVSLLGGIATTPALAEDWPCWRGPRGDGTWNAPKLPEKWPDVGLRQVWRQPVGGGDAGVVVADGRACTMDRQREPDETERVLCFDAATGKPLWTHAYPTAYGKLQHGNGPRAASTIHDGRVYSLGALGRVCCLDAATGRLLWTKDTVAECGARIPMWGFAASPFIFGESVIVHVGAQPDGSFIAFDRKTGKELWRSVPDRAGYCTPILIRHAGGPQLVCWTPENVRGLDPRDGKPLWGVPYKVTYGVSIASPIFQEGIVVVAGYWEGSRAVQLGPGATDAKLLWEENRFLRGEMSQPLYRAGHVYLLDKTFGLTCFELKTGKKLWDDANQMTPKGRDPQASLVWLNDADRAIILNASGELILARLNPAGYHEQSRTKIIGKTWAHPAFTGRCVFARDGNELVCVELPAK